MAENYDLIFGQSASQQYAWSDSDYQNGWQIVGSTPPTAEQFDALQRRSDTKAQDLNNRLSPIEEKSEADGRQAATTYTAGAMVTVDGLPNGWLLQCIVPGTSGTDAITLPDTLIDGLTIIDGTITWTLRKVATNGGLGYRQPNTTYEAGQIAYHSALPTGYYLECTTQGMTGSSELSIEGTITPDVTTVIDGTLTWIVRSTMGSKKLGYRQPNTEYAVGDIKYTDKLPTGKFLRCKTAGTTSATDLTLTSTSITDTVTDGTVEWEIAMKATFETTVNGSFNYVRNGYALFFTAPYDCVAAVTVTSVVVGNTGSADFGLTTDQTTSISNSLSLIRIDNMPSGARSAATNSAVFPLKAGESVYLYTGFSSNTGLINSRYTVTY